MLRALALLALLAATAPAAVVAGGEPEAPVVPQRVACHHGTPSAPAPRDVAIGPVLLRGIRHTVRGPRNRDSWKVPLIVRNGSPMTLSVERRLRGKVGLAYRPRMQRRIHRHGVRAADPALRFVPCSGEGETFYPGGFVVDRRRCARLRVTVEGQPEPIVRRVPVGRRCRR